MGLNAKEVVRVFACSKELSFNLSKIRHNQLYRPLNKALVSFKKEVEDIKGAMSSIREVIFPIEYEIEGMAYLDLMEADIDPGLGEGYTYLKKAGEFLNKGLKNIHLQTKVTYIRDLYDIQDAKETGDRVLHAFKEKYVAIESLIIIVNFFLALLFIRILIAAYSYHEHYLTAIDFDNVYITNYFKKIDEKREKKKELYLLPLNKKTLRRKAVQTVRAHYLSGENLLSLRIRYPNLLGWLVVFPAARMKCLICEETQPRRSEVKSQWQKCNNPLCPFVLCGECTADAGGCLACDPALALLSDIDSLSDEPPRRY
ncbi:unnamed protein product [Danaus chrysippus]|uniref:(African queen) hypothetical protein n=1 Tax=Danaus chrysippus TaxID=151541 RepID=A0A8J2VZB6_9NEOP|nr:unnamed protein product [Danaus chrysippus]